jgi:hypothetical protein
LPAYGPSASDSTAAQLRLITATSRASGKPNPGFCVGGCGQSFWFSFVSGIETVVPSTTFTGRPPKSRPAG